MCSILNKIGVVYKESNCFEYYNNKSYPAALTNYMKLVVSVTPLKNCDSVKNLTSIDISTKLLSLLVYSCFTKTNFQKNLPINLGNRSMHNQISPSLNQPNETSPASIDSITDGPSSSNTLSHLTPPNLPSSVTIQSLQRPTPMKKLKCLYTNATSLNALKLHELTSITTTESPHLILITETWFSDLSITSIPNYNLNRKDRNGRGGGIAIYVRKELNVSEPSLFKSSYSEQVWLSIMLDKEHILVGCVYRPPNANLDPRIDYEILQNIKLSKKLVDQKKFSGLMIAGDFNFPNIKWDNQSVQVLGSATCQASKFVDLLNDESLTQNVLTPTFLQADSTCVNILDYVITEDPLRFSMSSIDPPLGSANQGHLLIWYDYLIENHIFQSKNQNRKLNYKKGNYLEFNSTVNSYNWSEIFDNKSIEVCYE